MTLAYITLPIGGPGLRISLPEIVILFRPDIVEWRGVPTPFSVFEVRSLNHGRQQGPAVA